MSWEIETEERITIEDVKEIVSLHKYGLTYQEIAVVMDIKLKTIGDVVSLRAWTTVSLELH